MHAINSACPANAKILIPASTIVALKALISELEDRERCGALTVLETLQALDAVQTKYMCVQRTNSVANKDNFVTLRKLPEITEPKLTANNNNIFNTAYYYVVKRTVGMNGITIDYAMRGVSKHYDSPWTTREYKLKNYLLHTDDNLNNDNTTF